MSFIEFLCDCALGNYNNGAAPVKSERRGWFENTPEEDAAIDEQVQAKIREAVRNKEHPPVQTIEIISPGYHGPQKYEIRDNGNGFTTIIAHPSRH